MKQKSSENIVEAHGDIGLTVHGIRMAGKVLVVEMCDLDNDLEARQLHVAPLHEIETLSPLTAMDQGLRAGFGDQIWCTTAQALRFFTEANLGFCLLKPENLYLDIGSRRLLIAGWLDSSEQVNESCWLLEGGGKVSADQIYLAQLALLYHFLKSGADLHQRLEGEDISTRSTLLRGGIEGLQIKKKVKALLLRAAQLDGGAPLARIDALIDGVRSSLSLPVQQGVGYFLGGAWVGLSMSAALVMGILIMEYGHTVDYSADNVLRFGRAAVKYILL